MKVVTFTSIIISLFLYLNSPEEYNHEFCLLEMLLYLLTSALFLNYKTQRLGFLNFYTLFLFAFWAVNFIHPVFIYPNDELFPAYSFPYDEKCICTGIALAQLGISCFMYASLFSGESRKIELLKNKLVRSNRLLNNVSVICALCLWIYVFIIARISHFEHLYPRLMKLFQALLIYNFILNFKYKNKISQLILDNKKVLIAIIVFSFTLLTIGSRGSVIFVLLSISIIYYLFYNRISYKYILLLLFVGLFFMTIITFTRTTSSINFLSSNFTDVINYGAEQIFSNGIWVIFLDWVVNTRNLYDAMNYPSIFGYLWGSSYIPYMFVFIPFGGTVMSEILLGVSTTEVNTGRILSEWNRANYGLGTNIIGDLYMNFAEYGVIGGMFILGLLVAWAEKCKTINQLFVYVSLFACSVALPRISILGWTDLWAFLWIVRFLFNIPFYWSNIAQKGSHY